MFRYAIPTIALAFLAAPVRADDVPEKYRETVTKGLDWIAKNQSKEGYWQAQGQYTVSMTGLAGLALLMEGSTIREGKYSKNIRKAVDWMMTKSNRGGNRDGLIGSMDHPSEQHRYMYGHGFGLLFLASVYGEDDDRERREQLKDILTRAVKYCADSQSSRGGWYYQSKAEGGDNDEGSVTITQIQALRACRNAGIPVNKEIVKNTYKYLKDCTGPGGGIYYSYNSRNERPAITAAGIACLFNSGEYTDPLAKKWFKYVKQTILDGNKGGARLGHDEYTHFYLSQCMYILGDEGWDRLFPGSAAGDKATWSGYRANHFDQLQRSQTADGSWTAGGGWSVGPIYSTAMNCFILQLDRGALPIVQR